MKAKTSYHLRNSLYRKIKQPTLTQKEGPEFMRHKLYTLGELLIDFLPVSHPENGSFTHAFSPVAGGAPANVAASVCKLGIPSYFIGKVGEDFFGSFLLDTLQSLGVGTDYVSTTKEGNTALAFVSLAQDGERSFTFYRKQCADSLLAKEDIPKDAFSHNSIFHHGSISLISSPSKEATEYAIDCAQKAGSIISYDPNIRMLLWPDAMAIKNIVPKYFKYAHIIKLSDEEVEFLFDSCSDEIIQSLFSSETKLLLVTKGKMGAIAYTPKDKIFLQGFNVDAVDTTGAGDAFMAGILYQLLFRNITLDTIDKVLEDTALLKEMLLFANANAALTTTKKGAFAALPSLQEVETLIHTS